MTQEELDAEKALLQANKEQAEKDASDKILSPFREMTSGELKLLNKSLLKEIEERNDIRLLINHVLLERAD